MEYEMERVRELEREFEWIAELPDAEKEEIGDELVDLIVEEGVELDPREISEIVALIKGHRTKDIFRNVIKTARRVSPIKIEEVLRRH